MSVLSDSRLNPCWTLLLVLSLTACVQRRPPLPPLASRLTPLPQDSGVQVYFNQAQASSYQEPYRQKTRPGDNLEKLIVDAVATSHSTVEVAVQELRLPKIAQVLAERHKAGVKVRVILENSYNQPWSSLTAAQVAKLPERERDRYHEFVKFADTNQDGKLSPDEINQKDAVAILRNARVPVIDDTADGTRGSNLMHHKFVIVDGKALIVTSANFTMSDIHGDFGLSASRGNANNLLKIESPELAKWFSEEFNVMWGDGPGGKLDSRFGIKKPLRPVRSVQVGTVTVAVQFSPTSKRLPWEQSVNGFIGRTLGRATQSVDLALFVFSAQRLADRLEQETLRGVSVRALIDPNFAYRPYSEALDLMGVTLLDNCQLEAGNHPWQQPIATVGVPRLPVGDRLHHKFAVIDGKTVIAGSHNWTEAANEGNDETVLVIESRTVAAHFEREFERLYQGAVLGIPAAIARKIDAQQQVCAAVQGVAKSPDPQKLVNLNLATQEELEALPGVGPKLAQRLMVERQKRRFTSLEDVGRRVSGVGAKLLEKWRDRVTF